jgi:hypothetical protein
LGLVKGFVKRIQFLADGQQGRDLIGKGIGEIGQSTGLADVSFKRGNVGHIGGFYRAR